MAVNNDIPDVSVFGKGRGDFLLPCGYVDAQGKVFNRIYLREMTGVEDDIMDDDELNVSERISRVLTNCTEKITSSSPQQPNVIEDRDLIGAIIADTLEPGQGLAFSIPDRMAALLFLRRISLGDVYRFDKKCPECGFKNNGKELDLRTLKINYCKDATKRRVKVRLPRSGQEAILRVLSASGERRIAELRPSMKDVKSCAILARLESLDGRGLSGDNRSDLELVKALPKADRQVLINTFNAMEGSIETEIEVKCRRETCRADFKFDLDLGQVFFSNPEPEVKAEDLHWM